MDMGNLYSAALPAWMAAGLEEAAEQRIDLTGEPMVAIGYGSGDASEALPIRAAEGWQEAARRTQTQAALHEGAVDLNQAQYEALHDGKDPGLAPDPKDEFVIARVGQKYDPGFQDLGVEYYEYVPAS
jgi:hydroxymethylglutaryl-CoA synthase